MSEPDNQPTTISNKQTRNIVRVFPDVSGFSGSRDGVHFVTFFPNVIADAINYNCLIISAKNHGGARQLIGNEDKGLYYNLNDPHDLFEKIKYSLKNRTLVKKKITKSKINLIKLSKKLRPCNHT